MSIQPLPADVIAQIKSSTQITSLNGVVCELLKNSFDAGATKVDISIEYVKGNCAIEDNGRGILPSEFKEGGGLGKLHHTSKLKSETPVHGLRGSFLSSLAAMALLSITSHHQGHHSHNSIKMHKSGVVARQTPASPHQALTFLDHGTRVTVRDLFGNMPVRVKQRAVAGETHTKNNKAWKELKHHVVQLLLCWPRDVMVTIKQVGTVQRIVIKSSSASQDYSGIEHLPKLDITKTCSILLQASYLTSQQTPSWVGISAQSARFRIDGAISLDAAPNKHLQFFSFGIQPILATEGQTILHDEVNKLFSNSSFGNEEAGPDLDEAERARRMNDARYKSDGFTNREIKGGRKSVDRWPTFYINIQPVDAEDMQTSDLSAVLDNRGNKLGIVLELIQAMVVEFLDRHHFRPMKRRRVRFQQKSLPDHQNQQHQSSSRSDIGNGILRSNSAPVPSLSKPKSGPVKYRRPHQDGLLGVNVNLPSFRGSSSSLDTPFSAWSRVKESGQVTNKTLTWRQHQIDATPYHITAPEPSSESHHIETLLSSTRRIIRHPFEDVDMHPEQPTRPTKHQDLVSPLANNGDAVIEWINPTTKVKYIVNQRTGCTEAAAKKTKSQSLLDHPLAPSRRNRLKTSGEHNRSPTLWINNLLQSWENPVYPPAEIPIPQVSIDDFDDLTRAVLYNHKHSCSQTDVDHAFKKSSLLSAKVSKNALKSARVICQVDRKFILVKLLIEGSSKRTLSYSDEHDDTFHTMLVVIDQHAADERIRIEALMMELCSSIKDPQAGEVKFASQTFDKPIVFETSNAEIELLRIHRLHFQNWGIMYDLPNNKIIGKTTDGLSENCVHVKGLPPGIAERCKADPRLLIKLIRTEAWKCAENPPNHKLPSDHKWDDKSMWLQRIHGCPTGILDMLNSRACRSAIMFNDDLSQEQCTTLVRKLADCMFPFQCAHGRPSLVPLVDFETLDHDYRRDGADELHFGKSFSSAFRSWKKGTSNIE